MRVRLLVLIAILLAATTLACNLAGSTPATAPTPLPDVPTVIIPPIAPTQGSVKPTAVPVIGVATPTSAVTATITATTTLTATATTAPTTPPRSSGPLDFQVSIVGCRKDPSREGGVILSFRIDATGGNGVYTYFREGQVIAQVSERPATKGNAVIDAWRVRSGDGQEVEKKLRFTGQQFGCP